MKLLEQYLYAIGRKLPYKARGEIKKELNALLLDELENTYGPEPTEDDLKSLLADYGSPREVANRYKSNHLVVGSGYTDLYFFILKLIAFAMTIAFTVILIMSQIKGDITASSLMVDLALTLGRIFNGTLSGLGWLTIIFILLTRINNDKAIDLDEDWTPEDLKDIHIGPEGASRLGSAMTIFFTLLFIIVINSFPELITLSEKSFAASGLLGHTVNIDVFRGFLLPLSVVWFATILYHVLNLFYGSKSRNMAIYELFIEVSSAVIMVLLVADMRLYDAYTTLIGYRLIFMIVAAISIIEALNKCYQFIRYYILEQ